MFSFDNFRKDSLFYFCAYFYLKNRLNNYDAIVLTLDEEANDNTRVINNVSMIDNHDEAVQHHTIQSFERKTSGVSK